MAFNENNVMWTTEEILAAVAMDRIYEKVDAYLKEHPDFDTKVLIGILGLLGKDHITDMITFVRYLFTGDEGIRGVIGKLAYLLCMLERDNDWIAPNDE
jgi:hypothetical protein